MTDLDLRAEYKKETGSYARAKISTEITLEDDTTIYDLGYPIAYVFDFQFYEIPYIIWLEDQLIKKIETKTK